MKKSLFRFVFAAVLLVMTAGCTAPTFAQTNTPVAGTPAPDGQINVPGVSIQVNAPGPNPSANQAGANKRIASFLMGIWHGVISPITLVVSFFNPNVQMYEVHNDGSQYNLGFLLGVAIVFLLLGVTVGTRRRR